MMKADQNISNEMSVSVSGEIERVEEDDKTEFVQSDQCKIVSQSFPIHQESKPVHIYPDSPISFTESNGSNDLPIQQPKRRRKKGVCLPRKVKRKCKDGVYEVEYILDFIEHDEDSFCLVKWKGWEAQFNSWEPKENVLNCMKIMEEYFSSVYGSSISLRKSIDAYASSLVRPNRQALEELMTSLIKAGQVEYDVPSLKKVCMTISSLLSIPEEGRKIQWRDTMDTVKRDIMLRCLHVKRLRQLRSLQEWEDEINASSNNVAPIKVENEVDLEGPPENFYYVNEYIPGNGVTIPDEPPIGCSCKNCNASTCSCVTESGNKFAYYPNGTVKTFSRFPIYECNKLCTCSPGCINRVVQKGCSVKLSIFRTSTGCGWGVKALERIPKGAFVCEYVGEVINSEEAEERGKRYDAVGQTYLFDLDFNDKDQCPYTVDAAFLGNISHFINHSCNPNLMVYAVWVNCLDPDLPKLAFFSKKQIEANQEITFDYHAQTVVSRASSSSSKITCKCSSPNCRKYLF